jgi:spectinomycin phosphotransferase
MNEEENVNNLPSNQSLIDFLKRHYGLDVTTLTTLPLGADMNASVYKAETQEQSSYFVKLKHGHHHDISTRIMELLQQAQVQEIIHPIKTIYGQPTQRIDNFTLIVYPFVEGKDGFSRSLTDEQWVMLGKMLRQIHDVEVPLALQSQMRQETYSPKWREAVRAIYAHLEAEPRGDEIAIKLWTFMKENKAVIQRLVDRAEQLAQNIQSESPQFVLCHADLHGGNILIDKSNRSYIVDWDDPTMAPRERDLMFIGGGVGNIWNKPHEEEWFYEGYGKVQINRTILAYYRYERIVEDIAVYAEALLFPTQEGQNRQKLYEEFMSQFEPNGVAEIAFKTI